MRWPPGVQRVAAGPVAGRGRARATPAVRQGRRRHERVARSGGRAGRLPDVPRPRPAPLSHARGHDALRERCGSGSAMPDLRAGRTEPSWAPAAVAHVCPL
jgi:hypothetical protein